MSTRTPAAYAEHRRLPRSLLALLLASTFLHCAPSYAQSPYDPVDDVFYQIMPIAWRDSNNDTNRFGDFGGMTASLPYLEQLGVTAVWMTPIFPSAAYHGYQHGPANLLNSRFGTEPQFLAFVAAAHAKNIRVYIDFVAYGISQGTPYYLSAYNNPSSPYDSWLAFTNTQNTQYQGYSYNSWDGSFVGFIHWNLDNPSAVNLNINWANHWLDPNGDGNTSDGVDGFRLDHVYSSAPEGWGANIGFWQTWKAGLQQVKPNVFTFAEQGNWGSYGTDLLPAHDAAFTKPFEFAARDALTAETAAGLYSSMAATLAALPGGAPSPGKTSLATIGDHDVTRLATAIGANGANAGRAKAAAAVLMLQPLPPIIYYGDELGMIGSKQSYGSDADDIPMREPMKWNRVAAAPMSDYWRLNTQAYNNRFSRDNDGRSVEEQLNVSGSLLETYRALSNYRKVSPALRRGTYNPVPNSTPSVWSFVRRYAPGGGVAQTLLVAINLSGQSRQTNLNFSTGFSVPASGTTPTDIISGQSLTPLTLANQSAYSVTVPAYGYRIISANVTPVTQQISRVDGKDIPTHLGLVSDSAGQLLSTQTTPAVTTNNVMELNQMFVRPAEDGVFIGITGNLPTDGSALALFVDTGTPGLNVLDTSSVLPPPYGLRELTGTVLDSGFTPKFLYFINGYGGNLYVDQIQFNPSGAGIKTYIGQGVQGNGAGTLTDGTGIAPVQVALDNSNTAGVTQSSAASAATATKGFEIFLPFTTLEIASSQSPCQRIGLFAALVYQSGEIDRQSLPPSPGGSGTLGIAPAFTSLAGTQHVFFTLRNRADFNSDGFLDFTDFDAFVQAFEAGTTESDFNEDGFLDFTDFDAFVAAFESGC